MAAHFVEELLLEAERRKEQERIDVDRLRADQLLAGIVELERQMNEVVELVNAEVALLEQYRSSELSRLEKKLSWLTFNLDAYMRSTGEKTLRLPHGILKLRKGKDRIVISNMEEFLKRPAVKMLLKSVPESYQPDMDKIWAYYTKTGGSVPDGCQFIKGDVKFSYTTTPEVSNGTETDGDETEAGAAA